VALHIGIHKTGSKTLQAFLRHNAPILHELGFHLPKAGCIDPEVSSNAHNIAWELLDIPQHVAAAGTWLQLLREIEESASRTTILSAEDFEFLDDDAVERIARDLRRYKTSAIVYLRRHDHLFVSEYAHLLRDGTTVVSFDDWLKVSALDPRYDYRGLLERWEKRGFELIVRSFESEIFRHRELSLDFLDALGVKKIHFKAFKQVESQNIKLHGATAILLRESMACIEKRFGLGAERAPLASAIWWHLQQFLPDGPALNPLTSEQRLAILADHASEYAYIQDKYLSGGPLFSTSVPNIEKFSELGDLAPEIIVDGLSGVIGALWNERERLRAVSEAEKQ